MAENKTAEAILEQLDVKAVGKTQIVNLVEQSLQTDPVAPDPNQNNGISILSRLIRAGALAPNWWSKERERYLSNIWKTNNHLSIAVYNAQSKLVGIPFTVRAKNPTIPEHVEEAEELTYLLSAGSDFAKSWNVTYAKFIEDLLTQDSGAYMEIIGDGPLDGPIQGRPLSVRHLDSYRCIRTSDPEYPVLYEHTDGRLYKFHWTRIIYMAQMPSPREEMLGTGFCAVSRSLDIAQNLYDIVTYKQERLGSRPANMILIGKGITGSQIMESFYVGEQISSSKGRSRYASIVAIGSENPEIAIDKLELTHMDPFDEETSTNLGMFAISSAFGMDASELWPTQGSKTKEESNLRKLRSRGKLPAQTTADLELQFNLKVLPPHLKMVFDFQDDAEDMEQANIRDIRGRNRERDLGSGTIDTRTARHKMAEDGDLDQNMLEYIELNDGRLLDGKDVGVLFYTEDPIYDRHLKFSEDPLQIHTNDPIEFIKKIETNRSGLLKELASTTSESKKRKLVRASYALNWLQKEYEHLHLRAFPDVPVQHRRQDTNLVRINRTTEDAGQEDVEEEQTEAVGQQAAKPQKPSKVRPKEDADAPN